MNIPIYVTRPYGRDKLTGNYSASPWLFLITFVLIHLNVIVWSLIGLWKATEVVL